MDLNRAKIVSEAGPQDLTDPSAHSGDGRVRVYFRNLVDSLIHEMHGAHAVVGCVAWLTHPDILAALAGKQVVSIIVQKEDWLRPDYKPDDKWRQRQRDLYASISGPCRKELGGILAGMDYKSNLESFDAVRCVGIIQETKKKAMPRSHHKFVVMCDSEMNPYRVWTGSFNFTNNAAMSLDNAVVLDDPDLASAYFTEYQQVAALSEPLDWNSEWVEPEWRIGS